MIFIDFISIGLLMFGILFSFVLIHFIIEAVEEDKINSNLALAIVLLYALCLANLIFY